MDESTLSEALRLGSEVEHQHGDLGIYGVGLTTASIGLARRVEVITKAANGSILFGAFDLDEIAERNELVKWLGIADQDSQRLLGERLHGTVVRLSAIDRISNRNTTDFANILRKKVGQTFRKYLNSGRLTITVNGIPAKPIDPLMLDNPNTEVMLPETPMMMGEKAVPTVQVVLLPDEDAVGSESLGINWKNSGFYFVRNNREIVAARWFDAFGQRHPIHNRFRVEVCFGDDSDHLLHTDIRKMTVTPSQAFLEVLSNMVSAYLKQAAIQARKKAAEKRGEADHSIVESVVERKAKLIPMPPLLV